MNKSRAESLAMAVKGVSLAAGCAGKCSFPRRTPPARNPIFWRRWWEAVIDAEPPSSTSRIRWGYTMPDEFHRLISYLKSNVLNVDRAVISVHCHDDMGMAVANSWRPSGPEPGRWRDDQRHRGTGRKHRAGGGRHGGPFPPGLLLRPGNRHPDAELVKTSRIVAEMSGMAVPRSKAVVGANAFSHGSGIHQDGILKTAVPMKSWTRRK